MLNLLRKNNMATKQTIVVGADVGFASSVISVYAFDASKREGDLVGVATKLGERVIPSRVAQGDHQSINILNEDLRSTYRVNGLTFTVDPQLINESTRNPLTYHYSPIQCVLNQHLLQLMQLGQYDDIRMVTGLPISLYYKNNQANEEVIQKKINALLSAQIEPQFDGATIHPSSIEVRSEGVGAYFNYIIDEQGRVSGNDIEKLVAIIDVGGQTTDVTVISRLTVLDNTRTASANIGVLDVIREIQKELSKLGIVENSEHRLEEMLHTRRYVYRGRELPTEQVLDILDTAIKTVNFRLTNFITQTLGEGIDLNKVLVVGGGGVVFGEELRSLFTEEQFEIVDKPQYANAQGFAKVGLYNLRRSLGR